MQKCEKQRRGWSLLDDIGRRWRFVPRRRYQRKWTVSVSVLCMTPKRTHAWNAWRQRGYILDMQSAVKSTKNFSSSRCRVTRHGQQLTSWLSKPFVSCHRARMRTPRWWRGIEGYLQWPPRSKTTAIDLALRKDYTAVHWVCLQPLSCKLFLPEKLLVRSVLSPFQFMNGVAYQLNSPAPFVMKRAPIGASYRACTVAVPGASISLHWGRRVETSTFNVRCVGRGCDCRQTERRVFRRTRHSPRWRSTRVQRARTKAKLEEQPFGVQSVSVRFAPIMLLLTWCPARAQALIWLEIFQNQVPPAVRNHRRCVSSTSRPNLEPGPSALRWLLGDDAADRAWGRVKITSQLIGYFEGKAVLPRIYFRTAGGHRAVAKLSLGRAGLKFESFRQTVASLWCATRRKHNCCSSFSAATQTCEKKRQDRWGDGESLKISRDRPVFIANRSAEEKTMHSLQAVKRAFYADHWIPLVFFESAVCDRLGTRATRKRRLMQRGIICLLPAVFKRYGPPLAQQNMLLTRLLPLFKSKARLFRDHSTKLGALRGCAVFSFRLFLSSSEKKRKKFDLTAAVTAHVRTSAWPGELTACCPCTYSVRFAPVWSSTLCDTTVDLLTFTAFSSRASFPRSAVVLVFVEQPAKSCFSIVR